MTNDELKNILLEHKKWLDGEIGNRADLRSANLSGADLRSANLSGADLSGANLSGADLRSADLRSANLRSANLSDADLRSANLSRAYLSDADLSGADLRSANLSGADLRSANLSDADLSNIYINECTMGITNLCPQQGSFIGWKKGTNNTLIKLKITSNAKRSNATTLKCRCDKARVIAIYDENGNTLQETFSIHDNSFKYEVGKIIKVIDFDDNRWNECSTGIHFFIDKESARQYS